MRTRVTAIVLVGLAVATAAWAAGAWAGSGPRPRPARPVSPSAVVTRVTYWACPGNDRQQPRSGRPGSGKELVPAGADQLLLCQYGGLADGLRLTTAHLVLDPVSVAQLTTALNELPPFRGTYSCPADTGQAIVAFFRYPFDSDNPVRIGLSGCTTASNGRVTRRAAGAGVITELETILQSPPPATNPPDATIAGRLVLCGGPAPGRCFSTTIGECVPVTGCSTADRVVAVGVDGRPVAQERLSARHARFRLHVPPGAYALELLADGRHVHSMLVQSKTVTAAAGRTATADFRFDVP